MFETLLVPLDGSVLGEQSIPVAGALARRGGARVRLLRVHNPYPGRFAIEGGAVVAVTDRRWDRHLRKDEREYLARVVRRLKGAKVRAAAAPLLEGNVADELTDFARAVLSPLLIMSTHGHAGLNRAWLGSTADRVIRAAPCPVLLVRATKGRPVTGTVQPPRRLLLPVDGSVEAEAVLQPALDLGESGPSEYRLLEVLTPGPTSPLYWLAASSVGMAQMKEVVREERAQAREYLDALAAKIRARRPGAIVQVEVRVADHAASAIHDAAAEFGADVIAMTSHGRGMSRLFLGSVVDKVLRHTACDLLLVRPAPRAKSGRKPRSA